MSTPAWQISGQIGATLDSAARSLESVGILDGVLVKQSLEVDTLSWTQVSGIIPDNLQEIHLFGDGVRVFKGTITTRKFSYRGGAVRYTFVASGALYRMSKAQAVAEATDAAGSTATRPSVQFLPGDLADSITRLIALAPGVVLGSISPMFNVGRRTFTSGTWLGVLVDLLKPVADVATWVDYSVEPPALHIVRRPHMDTLELTLGKDAVDTIELNPRSEAMVTGISLAGASRNAAGQVVFSSQVSGDGSQIVAVSGPEIGAFVPPDNLPSMTIESASFGSTMAECFVQDPFLAEAVAEHGSFPFQAIEDADYGLFPYYPLGLFLPSGKYRLVSGSVMDWMTADYNYVASEERVSGYLYIILTNGYGNLGNFLISQGRAFFATGSGRSQICVRVDYTKPCVNALFSPVRTIYAKAAYEFLTPPSGMAEGMLSAANWLPYEGDIGLTPDFPWQRTLARRLNVLGADPGLRTAGALVQTSTLRIASGSQTIRCGAPLRTSLASVVSRYSPSSSDNIVQV
jgi:hypothetical protein